MVQTVSHRTLTSGVLAQNHVCLKWGFCAGRCVAGRILSPMISSFLCNQGSKPIFHLPTTDAISSQQLTASLHKTLLSLFFFKVNPHDRSVAYSKISFPQNAIQCFPFQFLVSRRFLMVTQQLLTSSSSSSLALYISPNKTSQKAVSTPRCYQSNCSSFSLLYIGYSSPP